MSLADSTSHVAAKRHDAGKHAAVGPFLKVAPRAPFGPSETWRVSGRDLLNNEDSLLHLY
jgi:hypothetical protein